MRLNLLGSSRSKLEGELASWADRPFRACQVFEAIHSQRIAEFEGITVLSRAARRSLEEKYTLQRPTVSEASSSADGTTKFLFALSDGATFEAVDIPDGSRRTLCISSQAGCALGCRFCVTGYWGAGRDLSSAEIVGQVYAICERQQIPREKVRLVLMGMGEPLLNLEAVKEALAVLSTTIPWHRMTVSTAGIVPGIDRMAKWSKRPNLAISLHAPDDRRRSELMPINRKYPLVDLVRAAREYPATRRRPLLIEYALIEGVNDAPADARAVARLLKGLWIKVNLIPMNPDPVLDPALAPPSEEGVRAFQGELLRHGIATTVRRRRGGDVAASCGQLRAKGREPRGFSERPIAR